MALLLGLALLPTGILALHAGVTAVSLRYAAVQETVANKELREIDDRSTDVQRLRTVTLAVAANPAIAATGLRNCNSLLGGLGAEFADFDAVVILDSRSRIRCSADATVVGRTGAGAAMIAEAERQGDAVIAFVSAPTLSDEPVLAAVAPLHGSEALFVALSRASRPLLARAAGESAKSGGFAALVDGQGQILQSDGLTENETSTALRTALANGTYRVGASAFRIGGSWAVARQIANLDLYLVHGWRAPPNDLADTVGILWALLAPLLLWLAAVGVSWWAFESYVARPLSTLDGLARSYARGEDTATPASFHNAPEEFLSLRRTLAAMAKTLRGREKRIAEALQEERALLREVNHRVKNNLQVVASILSILSRAADNEQQALGLARAQERVQLLALAQNEIHSSGEVHDVSLDKLAADICRALVTSRGAKAANVTLETSFRPARVNIDYAVPFAFLMGESLLRVLDGLTDGPPATVSLALDLDAEGGISFSIAAPDLMGANAAPPTAHRIIDGFARQIGATVEYAQQGGFVTRIHLHEKNLEAAE